MDAFSQFLKELLHKGCVLNWNRQSWFYFSDWSVCINPIENAPIILHSYNLKSACSFVKLQQVMNVPSTSVRECQPRNFNNHKYNWVTQELNLILATISFSSKICGSPSDCWVNSVANVKSHKTHTREKRRKRKKSAQIFTYFHIFTLTFNFVEQRFPTFFKCLWEHLCDFQLR